MECYQKGCCGAPVIQWVRLHSDEARAAHVAQVEERARQNAESQKLTLRIQIAALKEAQGNPPKDLSPADTQAFKERAEAQMAVIRDKHDAIPAAFDLSHHGVGSNTPLAACAEHLHDDLEWYARHHAPTCSGEVDCGCEASS
jgi:hypothetical protein